MVAFGGNVVALRFVNSFVHNIPNILIGKYLGAVSVGLYQRAYNLLAFAIDNVYGPIAAVALPPLARVQSDRDRFERFFLSGYSIIISCALPVVTVAAILSRPLILLVLGPQWVGAVELFRWLAIGSIFVALLNPIGMVLLALGRADRQVKITLLDSASIVLGYVAGLRFGLEGIAIGFVVVRAITYLPITIAMLHGTGVRTTQLLRSSVPPLTAALVAAATGALALAAMGERFDALVTTVLAGTIMMIGYLFILLLPFGQWPFYRGIALELLPADLLARFTKSPSQHKERAELQ
jgi:PST family polysaccharide transporter